MVVKNNKKIKNLKLSAFSLIEIVIFIVIISVFAVSLGSAIELALRGSTTVEDIGYAPEIATSCMEYLIGQKYVNGFASLSTLCPSNVPPTLCTSMVPSGYTMTCTITNNWSSNANLKQISVTVTGKGSNFTATSVVSNSG